jgi:hypothetical protein
MLSRLAHLKKARAPVIPLIDSGLVQPLPHSTIYLIPEQKPQELSCDIKRLCGIRLRVQNEKTQTFDLIPLQEAARA